VVKLLDEHERTLAFAEVALGQIKSLRQTAVPRNYEIWYVYATGYNAPLNKIINETLARATRDATAVQLGAGPRASLALARMAQALTLVRGEDFVTPDHVRDIAVPVLAHRLVLDPQAKFSGTTAQQVVAEVLRAVPVPA
jgi:MoxR-like ATPase